MEATYYILTMGCQMNERDSETLAGILQERGYRPAAAACEADIILLNTCAVREKPEHKVFSLLGEVAHYKRQRPGTIIGVCGCVAQAAAEAIREKAPWVDLVVGPRNYADLARLLEEVRSRTGQTPVPPGEGALAGDRCIPEGLPAARAEGVGAYVNITYGCDNYCAYCIVPYARGPLQSRQPQAVLEEVRELRDAGYRQITLLGQNVNAYGQDLPETVDFPDLLERIDALAVPRVRFTTSHPKDVPPRLMQAMRDLPSLCEWLHLPLQAGDDAVLARMGRGYTAQGYRELVARAREQIPGLTVSTDVMVGFPGETEAQFENTYRLMEEIRFDQAFTFKFSPRAGTAAEKMPDQVPEADKQARLKRLAEMVGRVARQANRRQVGEVFEVLVESVDLKSPGHVRGRTRGNKLVIFPGGPELIGRMVPVRAQEPRLWGFRGERAGP
jgi:tRNA-2-methylthio-N6-dimethylallyladenosine synthase